MGRPGRAATPAALLLVLLAPWLVACGASEEDRATAAVEAYFDALSERRFDRACELAGPSLRRTFADYASKQLRMGQAACPRILARIASQADPRLVAAQGKLTVRRMQVDGDTARAELSSADQRATLSKLDGDWRITTLDFGPR